MSGHLSEHLVYSFCCRRAKKLGMLIYSTTRIPLSERQIIEIEERMFKSAIQANSEEDVTECVYNVQDAFISETSFRTPSIWKFCRTMAITLAFRLSVETTRKNSRSIAWRLRISRILCRRMFKVASRATNDDDVNARIGNVYNAALVEHGIEAEV
jgi:hypothetical protein